MKQLFLALLLVVLFTSVGFSKDVSVRGYTRSDGTYVEPHHRSSPNNSTQDNWSTKGNVNPYTGQEGTKNPTPSYNSNPFGNTNQNQYQNQNNDPYGNTQNNPFGSTKKKSIWD